MNDIDTLISNLENLTLHFNSQNPTPKPAMDPATLENLLTCAIRRATEQSRAEFQATIDQLNERLNGLQPPSAAVEFKEITIDPSVECSETLDIVKSIPEFKGDPVKYVSWRQAAVTAHKLFEPFAGSSKYYQAVAIIRNKIVGNADSVLSTYNTVLNFKAILARLDFAYSDKKSVYTLEQELSTLRQGQKSINQFYDEVERKLTSIINKVLMTHEGDASLIASLNQKYRQDALRVFISGLKKPLCNTLFSCKPPDMPSALALAQELETNQNRCYFAEVYNSGLNKATPNQLQPRQAQQYQQNASNTPRTPVKTWPQQSSNHPQSQLTQSLNQQAPKPNIQSQQSFRAPVFQPRPFNPQPPPQPMDIDASMRTARTFNSPNMQAEKRALSSARMVPGKIQRINHLNADISPDNLQVEDLEQQYEDEQFPEEPLFEDEINFLGESQFSPTSSVSKTIKLLVDTGATKSYIKNFDLLKGIKPLEKPFLVKSIHGATRIEHQTRVNILNRTEPFFILHDLPIFDGILGFSLIKSAIGIIDTKRDILWFEGGQEKLKYLNLDSVNTLLNEPIPKSLERNFSEMIQANKNVFANPDEALPFNTKVSASIRTKDQEPVYSKYQAYPIPMTDFVNKEVEKMLRDGIIRPSRSPYNSPMWVVDKKGIDEHGRPNKRLVFDYSKLNAKTIPDKYPIPDPAVILSILGKAKIFSTLDLKSGFHQVNLDERDREKSAFSVNNGKYEFCRLPFGLKNAPSIFQRAIDDVLRDEIGKSCHVYIDDIIIFSDSEEKHIEDLDRILKKLYQANMRVF